MVYDVSSLSNGKQASFVLGAGDFYSYGLSPPMSSTLAQPRGLAFSGVDDLLFVADTGFNRVLVFDVATSANGEAAVNVLGQTSFESSYVGVSGSSLSGPFAVAVDEAGRQLFIADTENKRVLRLRVGVGR